MLLEKGQCYDFKINPVVGGEIEYDNIAPQNFVVAVNLAGQLHEQTRNLPDGARISSFTVEGSEQLQATDVSPMPDP